MGAVMEMSQQRVEVVIPAAEKELLKLAVRRKVSALQILT